MDLSRVVYQSRFEITAVRALDAGASSGELARKYPLSPKLLERWRSEWRARGESAFPDIGRRSANPSPTEDARRSNRQRRIASYTRRKTRD